MADVRIDSPHPDLDGSILRGAASDELQQELIDIFEAAAKDQKDNFKKLIGEVKKVSSGKGSYSNIDDALDDLGTVASTASAGLDKVEKSGKKSSGMFGFLESKGGKLAKGLMGVSKMASGLFIGFGLLATVVGTYIGYVKGSLSEWQTLTETGTTFGGSMMEAQAAVSRMQISMDDFTSMMQEHSSDLAVAYGTASAGALAFADTTRVMHSIAGIELRNFGITAKESAEALATYIGVNRLQNSFRLQSMQAQAAAAAELVRETQLLSTLTGRNRRELQQEMDQQARRAEFQAALMDLNSEQREAAIMALNRAAAMGPEAADLFISTFIGRGPIDEATQLFAAAVPEVADAVRNLGTGVRTGATDLNQFGIELAAAAGITAQRFQDSGDALGGIPGLAGDMADMQMRYTEVTRNLSIAIAENGGDLTEALASMAAAGEDTSGLASLLEMFDQVGAAFSGAVADFVKAFNERLFPILNDKVVPVLKEFVENLEPEEIDAAITSVIEGLNAFRIGLGDALDWIPGVDTNFRTGQELRADEAREVMENLEGTYWTTAGREEDEAELANILAQMNPEARSQFMKDQYEDFMKRFNIVAPGVGATNEAELRSQVEQQTRDRFLSTFEDAFGSRENLETLVREAPATAQADGGIVTGPSSGYPAELHGTEAVVPLPNGRSIPVTMTRDRDPAIDELAGSMSKAVRELESVNRHLRNLVNVST